MTAGLKGDMDERQATDDRHNPSISARNIQNLEHEAIDGYDRRNDGLDDHPISAGDVSEGSGDTGKNIDDVKDQEENAGGWTNRWSGVTNQKGKLDLKGTLKKNGPLGAIILLLGGGGIAVVGLLSPSLLLIQMTDMFTNNFNDAHTSTAIRTNAVIANKIGQAKNAFAETSDGKCGVRCRTTTMSDTMVRNLEARDFHVEKETRSILGVQRHTIQSITFPDGKMVKTGNEFKAALKDPVRAASFAKVHNSRTAYFLNSKFGTTIKHKLGINKAYKLAGDSKEKFNDSFRRAIGLPPRAVINPNLPPQTDEEKFNADPRNQNITKANAAIAAQRGAGVAGATCMAYNISKVTVASVKIAKMARYASYAMVFLNASHKLKAADSDSIDPGVMSGLGDILTHTETNKTNPDGSINELYGLSASDSYSWKTAQHGDTGPPPEYAKPFSLESAGLLGMVAGATYFAASDKDGRTAAADACRNLNNPAALVAQCALPSLAAGPFSPFAVAICTLANLAVGELAAAVVTRLAPLLMAEIIKTNVLDLDENTKGARAGMAIGPGAAIIMGAHAASYGLTEGSKDEISNYVKVGQEINEQDEAIARVEAKETPFDVYNKYSFLGSVANNLNLTAYANSSLTSTANTLVSTIPRSIAALTSTTNAGTYMPLNSTKADQYGGNNCPDVKYELADPNASCCPALSLLDAHGDGLCLPSRVSTPAVLNMDVMENKEFMIRHNYIDEMTGAPKKGDEAGRQFQLYVDNCVNRIDPPGETTQPIEAGQPGDYEWFIGAKCDEKTEMVDNFRTYALDEPIIAITGGEDSALLPVGSTTPHDGERGSGENSGNVNADGWSFPTLADTRLSRGYFEGHEALDIAGDPNNKDIPIYAMRDGTVTSIGNIPMPPYNKPCIGDEGSSSIQQSVVIEHDVNGKKYISTYHHVQPGKFPFSVGSQVKAGDRIATMGNTGCSTGQHLHVELWIDRIWGTSVDLGAILY